MLFSVRDLADQKFAHELDLTKCQLAPVSRTGDNIVADLRGLSIVGKYGHGEDEKQRTSSYLPLVSQ